MGFFGDQWLKVAVSADTTSSTTHFWPGRRCQPNIWSFLFLEREIYILNQMQQRIIGHNRLSGLFCILSIDWVVASSDCHMSSIVPVASRGLLRLTPVKRYLSSLSPGQQAQHFYSLFILVAKDVLLWYGPLAGYPSLGLGLAPAVVVGIQ